MILTMRILKSHDIPPHYTSPMKTYCLRQNENDYDNKPKAQPTRRLIYISSE